ncbi:MAG: tetratricopeptide repeat protein [Candidatus Acidiferrales bacterium]
MNSPKPLRLFRFGLFEADLENALLTRKGVRIHLQEQPLRILAMLLERAGQIVTREELRQELWPTGTHVDFDGSLNAALKRLRAALDDDPENPRFIETVPKRGYRLIAPVAIDAAPTKPELAIPVSPRWSITNIQPASAGQAAISHGTWTYQRFAVAAALVLVAALAAALWIRKATPRRPQPVQASAGPQPQRRSVAVLDFHNASGRSGDAWVSTALTEMLRTELGAGNELRVVPGEDVAQFRLASPWPLTDSLNPKTASQVGKALDGDLLVLGSYMTVDEPQNGSIRVDFRLQDSQTGELFYEGAEAGTQKQFFGLVAKIGAALRERLGLPEVSESEEAGVLSSLPSDPDADRFYALGLQKMHEYDYVTAKDLFLQDEKIAPSFPLVHLMLSRAWAGLGYDQKSRDEAQKAFVLSAGLPQTDKLLIEGAYYETLKDWDRAATAYRALHALYPDSVDYATQLMSVQNAAGHREEALNVVAQLRQLPPPASDDPRIDFWEARLISYTNGPKAAPLMDKAVAKASARGQKLLYAQFRLTECLGLIYSDKPQTAEAVCNEAYEIFLAAGNRLMAADAVRIMGDRRGAEGDFDGAVQLYQRALAMLGQLGEHEKTGSVLNNMAIVLENQGHIDRAAVLFQQAKRNFEECGDTLNVATSMANIGDVLMARGNLSGAEKQYQGSVALLQAVNPTAVAYDLGNIAEIRLLQGDVREALRYANQSLDAARSRGGPSDIAGATAMRGEILMAQDDLAAARRDYQRSLEIRQPLGDKTAIALSQAELAALSIEEGNPSDAEAGLRKSLAEFQSEKTTMDEILTETDLSRSLLMQGKLYEARKVISDAVTLSRTSKDPSLKLPVVIQDARVEAAELVSRAKSRPDLSDPQRKLQNVIFTASRLGYYDIECEAQLALGEIELRTNPAAARTQLVSLAEQAHERGLELISHKAAELEASSVVLPKLASVR